MMHMGMGAAWVPMGMRAARVPMGMRAARVPMSGTEPVAVSPVLGPAPTIYVPRK